MLTLVELVEVTVLRQTLTAYLLNKIEVVQQLQWKQAFKKMNLAIDHSIHHPYQTGLLPTPTVRT